MKWLNLGGGHHITKAGYDADLLCKVIGDAQSRYGVTVYLEPGEAVALDAGVQVLAAQAKAYQVPSNRGAPPPPQSPDLGKIKLIDYDFAKYGSATERKRLLAKWDADVASLPR